MPMLIDGVPQVIMFPLDGQHNPVEMQCVASQYLTSAQLVGISLAELQRPLPDRFVGHDDASTGDQFLNVAETSETRKYSKTT
jgi:hypothetical protein